MRHPIELAHLNGQIPQWLKLFPSARVKKMFQLMFARPMSQAAMKNIPPGVKVAVGLIVSIFQFMCGHTLRLKNHLARIVSIPVIREQSARLFHFLVKQSPGIGGSNMIRGSRDPLLYCPVNGSREDGGIITVQTKNEATVDHDAQIMKPFNHPIVVPAKVLVFIALFQVGWIKTFKSNKNTSQPGICCLFNQIPIQY